MIGLGWSGPNVCLGEYSPNFTTVIVGPLFFLVYINDIVNSIESDIYIFADDTPLMRPIVDAVFY